MKRSTVVAALVVAVAAASVSSPPSSAAARTAARPPSAAAADRAAPRPVAYERNVGQCRDEVRFVARGPGWTAFLLDEGPVMALLAPGDDPQAPRAARLSMRVVGAREDARWEAGPALPARSRYFHGNDPTKWTTDVETCRGVVERGVLPGVDLAYGGDGDAPEYRFLVAPGVARSSIDLDFEGARRIAVDARGGLVLDTPAGRVVHTKPVAWQDGPDGRREVAARFETDGARAARIVLGARDPLRPLVVDPRVEFSTYLGGTQGGEGVWSAALDVDGSIVVTGLTTSVDFPVKGPYQTLFFGGTDAFVTKFAPGGSSLVFSTFLGGDGFDGGRRVVLRGGAVWVAGYSSSTNYPVASPYRATKAGGTYDLFVSRLSGDGATLEYSTYFGGGGDDYFGGFDVDAQGAFAVGTYTYSLDLPVANAWRSTHAGAFDAALAKLSAAGDAVVFCTYLGGSGNDYASALAFDPVGRVCVCGSTDSTTFPLAQPAQAVSAGSTEAWVARFPSGGGAAETCTWLGGSGPEFATGIAVDASGAVVVTGQTDSTDFPVVSAYQSANRGGTDGFVAKYAADGRSVTYATYLGGAGSDTPYGVAVSRTGRIWVVGQTGSADFPTVNAVTGALGGQRDGFVARLAPDGAAAEFSSYVGGDGTADYLRAVALQGDVAAVGGASNSTNFASVAAYQSSLAATNGNSNAVATRIGGPPRKALQLAATLIGVNSVRLAWFDDSSDEDGFRVERRVGAGAWETAGTTAAGVAVFDDRGRLFETTHSYRVVSFNADGEAFPSNEVSITTRARFPIPPAAAYAVAHDGATVRVSWIDVDPLETGYEVTRSCEGSPFAPVATTGPDATFVVDDVPPDSDCVYRVHAVNEFGSSADQEIAVRTRPSLATKIRRGRVADSSEPGRDAASVSGRLAFAPTASPDGVCLPAADGFELRLGGWSLPAVVSIPAGDPRWRTRRGVASWKSGRGARPAVRVAVDLRRRTFSVSVAKTDLPGPPDADAARVCVAVGDDRGSDLPAWRASRDGAVLRFGR